MANFANCILSAHRQNMLSRTEADNLINQYNAYVAANIASGAANPTSAAKAALMGAVAAQAAQKRAIAAGTARFIADLTSFANTHRPIGSTAPSAYDAFLNKMESQAGETTSWKYRGVAQTFHFHSIMADNIGAFHRKFFGWNKRADLPKIDNAGEHIFGTAVNDPAARNLGDSMMKANEEARLEYNRAAGFEAIGKIQDGYIPQSHNPSRMLDSQYGKTAAEKYAAWRDAELPRLHMGKTLDPLTKTPLSQATPQRIENIMRAAWENIVTEGWNSQTPKAVRTGMGALATQRSDHRFFYYKDYKSWKASNEQFGNGSLTDAQFEHLRGMGNDIAAMDTFGPNPRATLEWMQQVVESEAAKAIIGKPSLHSGKVDTDTGAMQAARLQAVFNSISGPQVVSRNLANGFGDVGNVLTAAQLGMTGTLAAVTDPFISRATRSLWGLPQWKAALGIFYAMRSAQTEAQMVRSGIGLEDLLHVTGDEARFAGMLGGHTWSKVLADRATRWNGLQALTQSGKHIFAKEWQGMTADHVGHTWEQFHKSNPYFADAMDRYGFTKKDWDELRKTPLYSPKQGSAGFLQPSDVKNRDLGIRYAAMILAETERAVPTQSHRARSIVTANVQRGTVMGEIINSGLQYKNFAMSFMTGQTQAMAIEASRGGTRQGAWYAAMLFAPLTIGGAVALQINSVASGKDLHPMDPATSQGIKFWIAAILKGGSLGLAGDILLMDHGRFGATPADQLAGPTISLASDTLELTAGNVNKAATGRPVHLGRDVVRTVGRNVPIISTHPFTKAAYQRLVLDQLIYATDPEAYKYFNEQKARLRQSTGQQYWWSPGETSPSRAPEMSEANR